MTSTTRFANLASSAAITALIVTASLALPALASASTYAYVNQSGDVRSTEANTWQSAIATAPNIDAHSGVMLLDNFNGGVLNTHVNGF